ncbi:hypothetical protein [Kallotenue papyrolyticum]|uniref:hypothetical protein n=1 Tax=Kallotenue papyrolyticum TaxID=1325125 RepID=UPI00047853B8|nr:hypothetical protein [Kallotenue papyrolyticum]
MALDQEQRFRPGDLATWLHTSRGGYGYVIPVDAQVVRVNHKTIRVRVQRRDGSYTEINVRPERLRPRRGQEV